jgi:thioredoxin-dependent peroxiredoxin
MLKINDNAPDFTLPSTSGKPVALKSLLGQKVVLYFYPKDDTPGCTVEACDFRDNMARVSGHGAQVFGVSKDTLASHEKFRAKYKLPFDLLSDAGNTIAKSYGAFGKKLMYGKPVEGLIRSTFLIDEKGKIAAMWSPVKVAGHVDAVLAAISGDKGAAAPAKKPAKTTTLKSKGKPTASKSSVKVQVKRTAKTPAKSAAAKNTGAKSKSPAKKSAPKSKATVRK